MFRPYTCAMQKTVSAVPVLLITFAGLALAACGSASTGASSPAATGAPSTAIPTAAPTTAAAVNLTCPSAAAVQSGLGITVGPATSTPAKDLPTGDTGITCVYTSASFKSDVIVDFGTGPVSEPFISLVEAGEKKAAQAQGDTFTETNVSGVGSQAVIVTITKAGQPSEDGILAVSGQSGLVVTVLPPASNSQLESFASQLLG
jgi:hypothetical protein